MKLFYPDVRKLGGKNAHLHPPLLESYDRQETDQSLGTIWPRWGHRSPHLLRWIRNRYGLLSAHMDGRIPRKKQVVE